MTRVEVNLTSPWIMCTGKVYGYCLSLIRFLLQFIEPSFGKGPQTNEKLLFLYLVLH